MGIKNKLLNAVLGLGSLALLLWEVPWIKRVFAAITGFDFFYERSKDPSWIGGVLQMALNPPPGTALLVVVVLAALFYWSSRPRETRMSAPVIGILASVICFAGFGIWYLVQRQTDGSGRTPAGSSSASAAVDTFINLKFGTGSETPVATSLSNVWRWYALQTRIQPPIGPHIAAGWSVFLTLDKPTNVNQVVVSSNRTLPTYEVKDRDSRSIVIAFGGDIQDSDVEIKVLTDVPSVPLKPATPVVVSGPPQKAVVPPPRTTTAPADVPKKLAAIDALRQILDSDMAPWINKGQSLATGSWWNWAVGGEISQLKDEVRKFYERGREINERLERLQKDNMQFPDIHTLASSPLGRPYLLKVEKFVTPVLALPDGPLTMGNDLYRFLFEPYAKEAYDSLNEVEGWRRTTDQNALQLRKQISQ